MVTGRLRQRSWETPEGDKRSVTELEADEVGASLKWATAKVERSSQRGNGERSSGRQRQAERGGDFNDPPPFERTSLQRPRLQLGALDLRGESKRIWSDVILIRHIRGMRSSS
jgi:single-stranded DNA-binding protein